MMRTAHQRFVEIWSLSEHGVKTRVCSEHLQQKIDYILKTPTYQNTDYIEELIQCVKDKANEVREDISQMYELINDI